MGDPVAAAYQLTELANLAIADNRIPDALHLFEQAFSIVLLQKASMPVSLKLLPRAILMRPIVSEEHVIVRLSRQAVVFYASLQIVNHPLCAYGRFPMYGQLFSDIAHRLPDDRLYDVIIDLGDGNDLGDYQRIAFSSARADTVLILDPYLDMYDNYRVLREDVARLALPWRDRKDQIFWRGSAAGRPLREPASGERPIRWDWLQRLQLCAAARESAFAPMLDVALSSHHQIERPDLAAAIEQVGFLQAAVAKKNFIDYRYLIDIDGWSNSWSLLEKLIMGATLFKVQSPGGFRQWYYDKLLPWRHYIPVAADLSDFDDKIRWAITQPQACAQLATDAAALAETIQLDQALNDAAEAIMPNLRPL